MNRVRAGQVYIYDPVGMDVYRPAAELEQGEFVRVVNLHGCPKANTMNHCHVEARRVNSEGIEAWQFAGLVLVYSLQRLSEHGKAIVKGMK